MTGHWNATEIFALETATGNNNVYANGRQSIRVRMTIKVIDINGEPAVLSEKERRSITLVNFHGNAELTYHDTWSSSPLNPAKGKWDWSVQNNGGYSYFPSSGALTLSTDQEVARAQTSDEAYIDFYLRTVDVTPFTVSARITRDDGTVFYSRNMAGGALLLSPVRPKSYRPADYYLEEVVIAPHRYIDGSKGQFGVGHLSYFRFGLNENPGLAFRDITCSPGGLHGDIGPGWTNEAATMVGYVKPGQKNINYLFPLLYVDPQLKWEPRPGQILFTKTYVQAQPRRYFSQLLGRTAVLNTSLSATDEYGNVHQLSLRFKNNQRSGDIELV